MTRIPCRGRARFEEELSSGRVCHSVPALPVRPPFWSVFPLFWPKGAEGREDQLHGLPVVSALLEGQKDSSQHGVLFPLYEH